MESDYSPPLANWSILTGAPFVTVSPVGSADGYIANNGADYGPDTSGTTTCGIQEAIKDSPQVMNPYTSRLVPFANIRLLEGIYYITDPISLYVDWNVTIEGVCPNSQNDNTNVSDTMALSTCIWSSSDEGGIQSLSPYPAGTGSSRTNGYIRLSNFTLVTEAIISNGLTYQQANQTDANYMSATFWGQVGATGSSQNWQTIILDNFKVYDRASDLNSGDGNGCVSIIDNGMSELFWISKLDLYGSTQNNQGILTLQGCNHLWMDTTTIFGTYGSSSIGWGAYLYYGGGRWSIGSIHFQGHLPNIFILDNPSSLVMPIGQLNFELTTPTLSPIRTYQIPLYQSLIVGSIGIEPGTYNPFSASDGYGTPSGYTARTLTVENDLSGVFSHGFSTTTPAVPASGTAQMNNNPFPVRVYLLTGGTNTAFTITDPSGTPQLISATLAAGQEWTLDPGASITLTYSVAPTWKWYGV